MLGLYTARRSKLAVGAGGWSVVVSVCYLLCVLFLSVLRGDSICFSILCSQFVKIHLPNFLYCNIRVIDRLPTNAFPRESPRCLHLSKTPSYHTFEYLTLILTQYLQSSLARALRHRRFRFAPAASACSRNLNRTRTSSENEDLLLQFSRL